MRSKPAHRVAAPSVMPTTVMPIALHFGASASAITPMPRMPTVLPCKSFAGQRFHWCSSWARTKPGRSRDSASIEASAASDTGAPCTPCRLVTVTLGLQRRLIGDAVEPGAERLHPFQVAGACARSSFRFFIICPKVSSMSACGSAAAALSAAVATSIASSGNFWREPGAVLLGDVGRQRQQNQQAGHGMSWTWGGATANPGDKDIAGVCFYPIALMPSRQLDAVTQTVACSQRCPQSRPPSAIEPRDQRTDRRDCGGAAHRDREQ